MPAASTLQDEMVAGLRRLLLRGMNDDKHQFLMVCGKPPARLSIQQVAWLLGFN
jgi:hypothetical protein